MVSRLSQSSAIETCRRAPESEDGFGGELSGGYEGLFREHSIDTVVYSPPSLSAKRILPDVRHAERVFQDCARVGIKKVVLLSSATVYGASAHNPGLISESRPPAQNSANPIGSCWTDLEATALMYLGGPDSSLIILRPAAVLLPGGTDFFSRLFDSRLAITLPGHDPSIQLLDPEDLADAVERAVQIGSTGVYNVAPNGVISLRKALQLVSSKRVPIPRLLQRLARPLVSSLGLSYPMAQLEYVRYSWTVSTDKMKCELGFEPKYSSGKALVRLLSKKVSSPRSWVEDLTKQESDDFGMDKEYIASYGRTLFKFLERCYWRIELNGIERVPRKGRAVLVGVHRGLMPWDGVMALHLLVKHTGRYPRFLIHPTLVKFPFLFNFMTKLGGIMACQENADFVLKRDGILGIFPEGIHGAFVLYRDAYRLGRFGRDDYVRMALRNRAPIIPFVNVGSAEIFPILKRFDWRWWKRWTEWPYFPITPTWPLVPLPLPSKWHVQFLAPLHVENLYPPEAADDAATVRAISQEVRNRMREAIERMLSRRKSIFYGSVFGEELS
jgi:1-acyl-sn-glycerol-3-phosphate acyltransferase/nucleoside-diphosphate-sugar epimerase